MNPRESVLSYFIFHNKYSPKFSMPAMFPDVVQSQLLKTVRSIKYFLLNPEKFKRFNVSSNKIFYLKYINSFKLTTFLFSLLLENCGFTIFFKLAYKIMGCI